MDEFQFIARLLSPLAQDKAALQLKDDAAVIDVPEGQQLIVTKDAISEGVHFIGDEPADLIARKLLRVNLSDLAAMGATPYGYFLALILPASVDEAWLASFAAGLAMDQKTYGITLLGGDTTRGTSGLSLSLTALGYVNKGTALLRSGAKPGDGIYVSGTIGDAALGLQAARKKDGRYPQALGRYQLPEPRLALGRALAGIATSCIDVSDGLVQDLGHICETSQAGAELQAASLPLSPKVKSAALPLESVLTGGDDYELLFTVPASMAANLDALARQTSTAITRIGEMMAGASVTVRDETGQVMTLATGGYRHF
jgi:thiamine-monophosphate kinase